MASVEPLRSFASVGAMAAGLFVLPGILRGEYDLAHYLDFKPHLRRALHLLEHHLRGAARARAS